MNHEVCVSCPRKEVKTETLQFLGRLLLGATLQTPHRGPGTRPSHLQRNKPPQDYPHVLAPSQLRKQAAAYVPREGGWALITYIINSPHLSNATQQIKANAKTNLVKRC